jgi:peptidyl-tRNA hydrolase, PTH1 family
MDIYGMSKFLILGLGNVGAEYEHTRHNVGFDVLDYLAEKHGLSFNLDRHAHIATFKFKGKSILLVKPTTFMNLSGKALNYWMQQEHINIENVMIITDDLSLPTGKIRMRPKGSDGGHNGLKHIQATLNSDVYLRMRIGIGNEFGKGQQVDYVLGKWNPDEKIILNERIPLAAEAVQSFATIGAERTMNFYNGK